MVETRPPSVGRAAMGPAPTAAVLRGEPPVPLPLADDDSLAPPPRAALPSYAALDLGTNNCRLLIARRTRGGFRVLRPFSRIARPGAAPPAPPPPPPRAAAPAPAPSPRPPPTIPPRHSPPTPHPPP